MNQIQDPARLTPSYTNVGFWQIVLQKSVEAAREQ